MINEEIDDVLVELISSLSKIDFSDQTRGSLKATYTLKNALEKTYQIGYSIGLTDGVVGKRDTEAG